MAPVLLSSSSTSTRFGSSHSTPATVLASPWKIRSLGPPSFSAITKVLSRLAELLSEFGRSEVPGGEDGDLGVRAADVDGATGITAVGANRNRVVPREPGAGECQRYRREARQDPQIFPPESFAKEAHDAEETGVPGREHYHRSFCIFDPRERLGEVSLQDHGTVAVNTERLQVPPAANDERRVREQTFDLLAEWPSIETNDGYAIPIHAGPHAVKARAPGLAPAGSRVSKSTRIT